MKTRDFHRSSMHRARRGLAAMIAGMCLVALASCSTHNSAQRPEAVSELVEMAADGVPTNAFPQYWKRNTLVVDLLTAASSGGQVTLKPREGHKWPPRIAFRVMPGSVGLLEVQADQRLLMPVTHEGTKAVDLELVPGVYTASTPQITVRWEAPRAPPG